MTLKYDLWTSFDQTLFQTGFYHPAEKIIAKAMTDKRNHKQVRMICLDKRHPSFASAALYCVGRLPRRLTPKAFRVDLAHMALKTGDVEMIDAAMSVVENFQDKEFVEVLTWYEQQDMPDWMYDYVVIVLHDLKVKHSLIPYDEL